MLSRAESYRRLWDFAIPDSTIVSQKWVLSAMQSLGPELITMLWRILGNEQDVCDCYQDTFLHLAHIETGKKPSNIRAYVFRSASNTAISILRRKLVEQKNLGRIAEKQKKQAPAGRELDSGSLQRQLRLNIAKLPENLRDVVALHDLAEFPYSQVAKILKITQGTARVYRHKAVQLLAVWMKE
jgi:RNA polymerase sigma factor (sigma-70 family)